MFQRLATSGSAECPLVLRKFYTESMDLDRDAHKLEAFLVVKSTLHEYGIGKWKERPEGNMPPGARVQAFGVVSDEERDALDRVVAECARVDVELDEEGDREIDYDLNDLEFSEPGWFEVARETSG